MCSKLDVELYNIIVSWSYTNGSLFLRAYTMIATNHDGHKVYHDGHSNESVKTNGVLLRNHQIHGEFTVILPSEKGLWPSLSLFVAVIVIVCGHHGHCLWPSWSLFVAIMVIVCGHHCHCLWPSLSLFVAIMVIVCGHHCQ